MLLHIFFSCNGDTISITSPSGSVVAWKRADCFRMALWLAIYNEFYSKNVSIVICIFSFHVCTVIKGARTQPAYTSYQIAHSNVITICIRADLYVLAYVQYYS